MLSVRCDGESVTHTLEFYSAFYVVSDQMQHGVWKHSVNRSLKWWWSARHSPVAVMETH